MALHERGRKIQKRTVHHSWGSEGPCHDPYGWEEYTVCLNDTNYTLRYGALGYLRLSINKRKMSEGCLGTHRKVDAVRLQSVYQQFERLTGVNPRQLDKYYRRIHPPYDECDPMGPPSRFL